MKDLLHSHNSLYCYCNVALMNVRREQEHSLAHCMPNRYFSQVIAILEPG
jgi:hypothetical protein